MFVRWLFILLIAISATLSTAEDCFIYAAYDGYASRASGWCTGFNIAPQWVITCRHMSEKNSASTVDTDSGVHPIYVQFQEDEPIKVAYLIISEKYDLAILRLSTPTARPADKITTSGSLMIGDPVRHIGFPDAERHETTGTLKRRRALSSIKFLGTDMPVRKGFSGGPVYNANNEVVGITTELYSTTLTANDQVTTRSEKGANFLGGEHIIQFLKLTKVWDTELR